MRSRLARLLLLLTALWLPLQAVAGINMKLCMHAAAAAQVVAEPCPFHAAAAAPSAAPDPAADSGCDRCGICHLAGACYMPAAEAGVALLPAPPVFQPAPVATRASHIPEPPQQPPRRSA